MRNIHFIFITYLLYLLFDLLLYYINATPILLQSCALFTYISSLYVDTTQ